MGLNRIDMTGLEALQKLESFASKEQEIPEEGPVHKEDKRIHGTNEIIVLKKEKLRLISTNQNTFFP